MDPLAFACPHIATPQEQDRDPDYTACNAGIDEPCLWAARHDSQANPPFHTERLEQLLQTRSPLPEDCLSTVAILNTGLV